MLDASSRLYSIFFFFLTLFWSIVPVSNEAELSSGNYLLVSNV